MKYISWNVNGFKSCMKKGFEKFFYSQKADFFCIQESKLQNGNCGFEPKGYNQYWNYCTQKGYSGTAIFAKHKPLDVKYELENYNDSEGRIITLEYNKFYLINVYTPNSKSGLIRLDFRAEWDDSFKEFLKKLNNNKPLVVCGDLNAIFVDNLGNSDSNGMPEETAVGFHELLDYVKLTDSFEYLHPSDKNSYTWCSYASLNSENKICSRIDHFLISNYLCKDLKYANIYKNTIGSDHFPIGMELAV